MRLCFEVEVVGSRLGLSDDLTAANDAGGAVFTGMLPLDQSTPSVEDLVTAAGASEQRH